MDLSVIIITRNEAFRLQLCLAAVTTACARSARSLGARVEVLVVDDASTDETRNILAAADSTLNIRVVCNTECLGRSASRNRGAIEAQGRILLFLDGDTLVSPDALSAHLRFHEHANGIARGETFNLRQARFLHDPTRGIPFNEFSNHKARPDELIHVDWLANNFEEVERRAQPGIYPGLAARRLAELEIEALRAPTRNHSLWMAMTSHNISLEASAFRRVEGFTASLTMNEHRELALKAETRLGIWVHLLDECRSYHLCHSNTWRDPLASMSLWEPYFISTFPRDDVKLLPFFWLTIAESKDLPPELRIPTLSDLTERSDRDTSAYENFRRNSPLFGLSAHV